MITNLSSSKLETQLKIVQYASWNSAIRRVWYGPCNIWFNITLLPWIDQSDSRIQVCLKINLMKIQSSKVCGNTYLILILIENDTTDTELILIETSNYLNHLLVQFSKPLIERSYKYQTGHRDLTNTTIRH